MVAEVDVLLYVQVRLDRPATDACVWIKDAAGIPGNLWSFHREHDLNPSDCSSGSGCPFCILDLLFFQEAAL
ncbi:hypothetical protein GAO43_15755 [Bacteroides thetaiotaomicron]|jgi:hypothetical protein|uniref:Uncharacterized protein n=1 Tax=Bacteroides thetaiotaomicron TaxID=818 RepID=A0A6I0M3U9_BACT4|nr:hypothetical protein [Bacteroides thetaiotaomicron]KAB4263939.1 hypothetical protein GAO47_23150 [Bacteroides thetaiotaomicron]KAB4270749.1 hypothetical protein GAO40_18430 [Bacteroides thetaiotaomicron]KAB4278368.1 hypothetical protein GAO35_14940 [Bacteroides thetaiotaomicron]KAB4285172.1 hypothetical protein GAO48_14690 [Bacteroides thetaiotaomicron]KAB4288394.1 hypothetical protein GAO45_14155 [Bacteroides thetaiotaomicron]